MQEQADSGDRGDKEDEEAGNGFQELGDAHPCGAGCDVAGG